MNAQFDSALAAAGDCQSLRSTPSARSGIDSSERQLVIRAQAGDRRAFDLLALKYQGQLLNVAYRYCRNVADAEDIMQAVLLRAYQGVRSFRGECAFYTWLHRIAINSSKNALARRARDPMVLSLEMLEDEQTSEFAEHFQDTNSPEAIAIKDEVRSAVSNAMQNLPREFRSAIELREIEGMSYDDIALAMNSPVGTVRSRISRARDAIDRELSEVSHGGLGRRARRVRDVMQEMA